MIETNINEAETLVSITWDNWGIIENLADEQNEKKYLILKKIEQEMKDRLDESSGVDDGEVNPSSVARDVKDHKNGKKVETKFTYKGVDLGAIMIDFPSQKDGEVSLQVTASLPQKTIKGNGLADSKAYIRERVESETSKENIVKPTDETNLEIVPAEDLEKASSGRNSIARRIVKASKYKVGESEDFNIDEFVALVMGIYDIYTSIFNWLAEIPTKSSSDMK